MWRHDGNAGEQGCAVVILTDVLEGQDRIDDGIKISNSTHAKAAAVARLRVRHAAENFIFVFSLFSSVCVGFQMRDPAKMTGLRQ